jgi:hypothetical protein
MYVTGGAYTGGAYTGTGCAGPPPIAPVWVIGVSVFMEPGAGTEDGRPNPAARG